MSSPPSPSSVEISRRIRAVLSSRKLSMAEISRESRLRFSGNSLFWIQAHFYEALHHPSFSPSLHQIFALSVLTNYRLVDWVRLFGFSLDTASEFQVSWPRPRTIELDSRVYHPEAEISWFDESPRIALGNEIAPLHRWLSGSKTLGLDRLVSKPIAFRYFKIGTDDVYAYPDLLPESIVRVNPQFNHDTILRTSNGDRIVAIEHARGVSCGYIRPNGDNRILLCSKQLPYAPLELSLGSQTRILGVVDLEIRRLVFRSAPTVALQTKEHPAFSYAGPSQRRTRLGEYLRFARMRSGLSFQAASARSREIALALNHPNYFCAASALSDIEASDRFPRHIHKLISLSALYGVPPLELAALVGLSTDRAGKESIPVPLHGNHNREPRTNGSDTSRFMRAVEERLEEVPLFLHKALRSLTGLSRLSVPDLFWAGSTNDLTHPYLRNAAFLAVNRKSKQPTPLLSSPVWAQPLYVLELRNGRILCAACTLHGETLMVRQCTKTSASLLRLENHIDAEVLGKVVALVRSVERRTSS